MDVYEAISRRRSIREYRPDPVEPDKLERLQTAIRLAPTARNQQELRFVFVTDPATRQALSVAAKNQKQVAAAPLVVAACGLNPDYVMTCGQPAYAIDAAIALDHLSLAAVAEGLGTCWVGAFHEDQVKAALGIPERFRVVQLMAVGYPAEAPDARDRRPPEFLFAREEWGETPDWSK